MISFKKTLLLASMGTLMMVGSANATPASYNFTAELDADSRISADTVASSDRRVLSGLRLQRIRAANRDFQVNSITSVPDAGMTLALLGLALAGMGLVARRKN